MTAGDYPGESTKNGENVVTKQRQDTDKKNKKIPRFDRDVFVWNLIVILFSLFFFFFLMILTQNTDTQTDRKEKETKEGDQKKMDTY